jgi:hypothetical protein
LSLNFDARATASPTRGCADPPGSGTLGGRKLTRPLLGNPYPHRNQYIPRFHTGRVSSLLLFVLYLLLLYYICFSRYPRSLFVAFSAGLVKSPAVPSCRRRHRTAAEVAATPPCPVKPPQLSVWSRNFPLADPRTLIQPRGTGQRVVQAVADALCGRCLQLCLPRDVRTNVSNLEHLHRLERSGNAFAGWTCATLGVPDTSLDWIPVSTLVRWLPRLLPAGEKHPALI